jgi:hypothetical protein
MLKGILSIGGKPGLYKMISQTKNGLIVESLLDNKRMPAFSSAKISALEDISVFTEKEDIPLVDVFKAISDKEGGKECPGAKLGNDELKKYMEEVLPTFDKERVYISDIKKILNWYNILLVLKMLNFEEHREDIKETEGDDKEEKKDLKSKTDKKTTKKTAPKTKSSNPSVKTSGAKSMIKSQPKTKSK